MNVTYGGNDITDGQQVEWGIFEVRSITIEIDTWDFTSEQSDYKFKLDLNSSETGFYAYNGNFECDPANIGNAVTTFTPGRAPNWTIVRCGLGSLGNNGFQVIAQLNSGGADIALNNTGEIPLAWHREDRQVSYLMQLATIEGSRPAALPGTYVYDRALAEGSVSTAVNRLSNRIGGAPFSALPPYDVEIKAYWAGSETNTRGCQLRNATACIGVGGSYPHLDSTTMWIKYPPAIQTMFGDWPEWTDVTTAPPPYAYRARLAFFYLPQVIGHELGHGLGVIHLPLGHMMGRYIPGTVWTGPTPSDLYGFNQTRLSHSD